MTVSTLHRELPDRARLRARCAELDRLDDITLAARMLGSLDVHAGRSEATLRQWGEVALAFAAELRTATIGLDRPEQWCADNDVTLVEDGSAEPAERFVMAQFRSRDSTVVLYTRTLELAGRLVALMGWESRFAPEAIRRIAICHEIAHRMLDRNAAGELRRQLGHVALRIGRMRLAGHVLGADEVVAHELARTTDEFSSSPLLLGAALHDAVAMIPVRPPSAAPALSGHSGTDHFLPSPRRRSLPWGS